MIVPAPVKSSSYVRSEFIEYAAKVFLIKPEELLGHSRKRRFARARFAAYKALYMRSQCYSHVGRWCNRDHSTVRYGIDRAEYYMAREERFRKRVEKLIKFCQAGSEA